MSNYLSRLARASGLDNGPRPSSRAGAADHSTRGASAAAPREPPHTEQVVFDEQPWAAPLQHQSLVRAGDQHSQADRGRTPDEEAASHEKDSPVLSSSEARDISSAQGRVRRGLLPGADERHESLQGAGRVRLEVPHETGERQPTARRESSLHAEDAAVSSGFDPAAQRGGRDSSRGQTFAAKGGTVFDAAHEGPDVESVVELLTNTPGGDARDVESPGAAEERRAYMREIVEWIAAPPAPRAEGVEESRAAEERAAARVREQPSVRVADEASSGLTVDDLTLSIGSIHVVVEEPPGQPQARPEAPASTARAGDAFEGEGSRLRRHYIRV